VSSLGFAALPLDQRPPRPDEWGYRPADGASVPLNPPTFTWIAPAYAATYAVQFSPRREFPAASMTTVESIVRPTYTHDRAVAAGTWFWRYRMADKAGAASEWSVVRRVIVPADAASLPMPTLAQQRAKVPTQHPRLFLRPEDLPRLRELAKGREAGAFAALEKAAEDFIKAGPTPEPAHKGPRATRKTPSS
jgi:hypothetical protein